MENNTPKFINPFTDFGFKKIFGEEANKDLLIDFLNELLRSQNVQISDLTYKNTSKLGISPLDRNVIFDLLCENPKGEKFTIELQKAKQTFFKDRMLYYSSFSIQEQGLKGNWNYELKSVYVIAILDFPIDDKIPEKDVVSHNRLLNVETHEVFYNKLLFVTLEMPYFNKTIDELETNFDKWLYVLKNLHKLDEIPERLRNIIFQKLFSIASYSTLSKIERVKYEESLKYYNDLKNSLDTAFEEGKLEAINEIKPLLEQKNKELEQKEKELEQERQKAEQKDKQIIETAKKLKAKGFSNSEISEITGLSIDEIENL